MKWTQLMLAVLFAALIALPTNTVLAEKPEKKDKPKLTAEQRKAAAAEKAAKFEQAISSAKTSLAEAVTTAQTHAGGKAIGAAYKMAKDGLVVDVLVLVDGKKQRVTVNADSGLVITKAPKPKGDKPKKAKKDKKPKQNDEGDDMGDDDFNE